MALTKFNIDTKEYTSYASLEEAAEYLRVDERWAAWNAISDDEGREIRLIQATRLIDAAGTYTGEKVSNTQDTEFPRDNLECNGEAVSETLPEAIVQATIRLAGTIAANPSLISVAAQTTTGRQPQVRKLEASVVSIEYFELQGAVEDTTTQNLLVPDSQVSDVLRCYLAGAVSTGLAGGIATGTEAESEFTEKINQRYFAW